MSTRFALLTALIAFAFSNAEAQSGPPRPGGSFGPALQTLITGTVAEDETGDPIAGATVGLWRLPDSTLATGAVTTEDGSFTIEGIRPGRYYARVSFVGFRSSTIPDIAITPQNPRADLGTIRLTVDTQLMEEVEVTAERSFMEVGIDRTIYNVKDQLVSVGGSAVNVLENIPSVEVDIDGKVSLRGNQNVAILINGKPSPMTGEALTSFLMSLPADAIERVEVIPNPSAKYEPDGMAGILNLVLKQNRNAGLSGGVTLSGETNASYGASANVNYTKDRIGVTGSYSLRNGNRDGEGWRFRENRFMSPHTYLDQDSFDERNFLGHTLSSNIDYNLSKMNSLSLSAMISVRGGDTDGLTSYTESDAADAVTSRFDRTTLGDGDGLNSDIRLSFRRVIDPSRNQLTAEVRYSAGSSDDFNEFLQEEFHGTGPGIIVEHQINERDELNSDLSLQLDYTRPFGSKGKIEAGYKGSLQSIDSDFYSETLDPGQGVFVPDVNLNNEFVYDQLINAAYGIVGTQIGKVGLQGGVRLEQARTTFDLVTTNESYDNDYFSVFPSAYATYELSSARNVKLSYSKRINRPRTGGWFNQLNPFNSNEDPYFRRVGNPYLQPEYVHSFEAGFTQLLGRSSLTLTPYFRRTVDVIRFVETIDDQGVTTLTFENLDNSDSWGAELIGTLQLGRRLNAFANFSLYKVVTDGSNIDTDLSNNAVGWSTRANATINVMPSLDVQLSWFYRAPMDIEGGRMGAWQMADIAVRHKLLKDRANLSLRMNDVFGTMGMHMERDTERFFQITDRSFNAQRLGLTFKYNFGRQQSRPNRRRGDERQMEGMDEMEMMQ